MAEEFPERGLPVICPRGLRRTTRVSAVGSVDLARLLRAKRISAMSSNLNWKRPYLPSRAIFPSCMVPTLPEKRSVPLVRRTMSCSSTCKLRAESGIPFHSATTMSEIFTGESSVWTTNPKPSPFPAKRDGSCWPAVPSVQLTTNSSLMKMEISPVRRLLRISILALPVSPKRMELPLICTRSTTGPPCSLIEVRNNMRCVEKI